MTNKACALFLSLIALAVYLALVEAGYFLWAVRQQPRIRNADAVVVYPLGGGRLEAGAWLIETEYADTFCLIGASRRRTFLLAERYGVRILRESLVRSESSRSTFEDALRTKQLARKKGYERVLVVTSGFHKPRALLLTKCLFLGSGIRAEVLSAGRILGDSRSGQTISLRAWRGEFVALWGSLLELGYYAFSGRLIRDLHILRQTHYG